MVGLLKFLARLPLRYYHALGCIVGWLMYWCFPTYAKRAAANLQSTGLCGTAREQEAFIRQASREAGKAAIEWNMLWYASHESIDKLSAACEGWGEVEQARRDGKGIIFLVPHLGSFPMTVRYLANRLPLTALYRPPQFRWVEPFMMAGSRNANLNMAPTNRKGVEQLLQALKRGESIVLPPDQAPSSEGAVWADFFGRPAYTMTLARKIRRGTGAALIGGYAERLPEGRGFKLFFQRIASDNFDETALNRLVEDLVKRSPAQFMWSYNRYKIPRIAYKKGLPNKL